MAAVIGLDEAQTQAELLRKAANDSPVRQLRATFGAMAREWERAVEGLESARLLDTEGTVDVAGAVVPGQLVMTDQGWRRVMRVLRRDGISIHVDDDHDPRGKYVNPGGYSSPVVVRVS